MKNRTILMVAILLFAGQLAKADDFPNEISSKDTIEVHFGEKGTILIHVESKEDLEALKEYDINSMLEDVDVPTKDDMDEAEKIILQDDEGTKYLKDSVEEDEEFRQLENEFDDMNDDEPEEKQEYNYERKAKRFSGSKTSFVSALDFGMNNYLEDGKYPDANNEQYTVKPWGSWYVAIMPTWQTHIAGKFALDYGGGISWYNFKFQDPRTMLVKGDEGVEFEQWPVDLQASKSKLTVVHLNAHFVPMFDFGYRTSTRTYDDGFVQKKTRFRRNGFRIGAGGYVGTRIGSWQKLVWRSTGHKSKLREKDNYYLNNIRYGARFILGYGEVDIFVNYDISTLFAENRGPELNAISFGLSF
ncbi:MAG: hypothetical protein KAQ62_26420 [Cyclobacteriaceae bacterium]|nr:hypothetical protein [Cyclobacteriaceae bacterium]MCK5467784.1 hypothetical protein [Cyclobacteriaceae bacterium]